MKRLFGLICLTFLIVSTLFSQRTEIRKLSGDFDKLSVFGKIDIELVQSSGSEITINAGSDVSLDAIKVELQERMLKISLTADLFGNQTKVQIKVPFKTLREIESTGGANIRSFDSLGGDKIYFKATSGGNIYLTLKLNALDAKVTQGSVIVFKGETSSQVVSVASGGVYSAYGMKCKDTYARAATGGKAKVFASGLLEAKTTTKGWVGYTGNPKDKKIKEVLGGIVEEGIVNENEE